jgi:oligopeptide/dipeptide ABC transporter ATP-binding protein
MQIVFQDPFATLDPRMRISAIVEEPLLIHSKGLPQERALRVREILDLVGIVGSHLDRKPHELSGGQRQRIALARSLVLHPDLVILDEPLSALDVSIQAQALNLLRELQERLNLTYVFITHDLAVAEYVCTRVAVIYLGAIVETTTAERLFRAPLHPYSAALLSAAPDANREGRAGRRRIVLRGEADLKDTVTEGCRFQPRCPVGKDRELCKEHSPPLEARAPGHMVSCHFPGEIRELTGSAETSHDE